MSSDSVDLCIICLEFCDKIYEQTKCTCKLIVHDICIKEWLQYKPECPICKITLFQSSVNIEHTPINEMNHNVEVIETVSNCFNIVYIKIIAYCIFVSCTFLLAIYITYFLIN